MVIKLSKELSSDRLYSELTTESEGDEDNIRFILETNGNIWRELALYLERNLRDIDR